MAHLVTEAELKIAFDYERRGDLERCLREQGINVLYGKGGVLVVPASEFDRNKEPETQEIEL